MQLDCENLCSMDDFIQKQKRVKPAQAITKKRKRKQDSMENESPMQMARKFIHEEASGMKFLLSFLSFGL